MLTINNTVEGYIQNLEIKGNTTQNLNNLSDIRSAGDKVEGQELYKIPLLCVDDGNVFSSKFENGALDGNGLPNTWSNYIRSVDFVTISSNTKYSFRLDVNTTLSNIWINFYDINKNFIKRDVISVALTGCVTSPSNAKFVKVSANKATDFSLTNYIAFYLCVGDKVNTYNAQSYKLTILSPVQVEKVGTTSDRIIERNGVWGIEKNVFDYICDSTSYILRESSLDTENTERYSIRNVANVALNKVVICDKLNSYIDGGSDTVTCIYVHSTNNRIEIKRLKNDDRWSDVLTLKEFLEGSVIKYATTVPQFIPLPNNQQIALRTFANKTNIIFDAEVAGTVKGNFPKSIGATLQTHSNQIDSINADLEKVKKLEEATTTTVVTESDFVSIDETQNGYLSDIKLEGKTLVNIVNLDNGNKSPVAPQKLNNGLWKFDFGGCGISNILPSAIKPDTLYTICCNIIENTLTTTGAAVGALFENSDIFNTRELKVNEKGLIVFTQTSKPTPSTLGNLRTYNVATNGYMTLSLMILEGDYTQNPPSYFEGLKSVGDGTDEIVVSSINDNLFNGENVKVKNNESWVYVGDAIPVELLSNINFGYKIKSDTPFTSSSFNSVIRLEYFKYNSTGSLISDGEVIGSSKTITITSEYSNCLIENINIDKTKSFIKVLVRNGDAKNLDITNIFVSKTSKTFILYKQDQKQILYCNNEGRWVKTVLREKDTIEKRADGKYYYHKKGYEKVLNGSEVWVYNASLSNETTSAFYLNDKTKAYGSVNVICDKLKTLRQSESTDKEESIFGESYTSAIYIRLLNTKANTLDLFKKWLQLNPFTIVYELAKEEVYECTPIDVASFENETNWMIKSGYISPKTSIKLQNCIGNVISTMKEKISIQEKENKLIYANMFEQEARLIILEGGAI